MLTANIQKHTRLYQPATECVTENGPSEKMGDVRLKNGFVSVRVGKVLDRTTRSLDVPRARPDCAQPLAQHQATVMWGVAA